MKKQRNFVFYSGPSMLDGAPIVAIATIKSRNSKTEAMIQTWIMRADLNPVSAARRSLDSSICGSCKHQGQHDVWGNRIPKSRSCYVRLDTAPLNIWKTWARGRYDDLSASLSDANARVAGKLVRLGSYGDPAAVPFGVWESLLSGIAGHTGYTHQWRLFPELARWVMASCDSIEERVMARILGFRTFRVAPRLGWTKEANEVLCAASAEAGRKTTCAACRACGGLTARARADIVIPAHGGGRNLVA